MGTYLASLNRLLERNDAFYWPTHGPRIEDPKALVRAYIDHRAERERQIADCLGRGIGEIPAMVAEIYAEIPTHLHPAAASPVIPHLIHMCEGDRATSHR
mgnify:CR=1 FL=1